MEASVEQLSLWDRPAWQVLRITWEKVAYAALFVALVLTRFWDLGARVMSHDESLHTQYSWYFFTGAGFQHSPLMHGPSLFLATAFNYFLFGDDDFTSRIFPAVIGIVLALVIPYLLRPWLGKVGALATAFMFLISPAILYHSRYIRHDVPLITFAMVCFVALIYYMTRPKDKHLYWLAAGMALMFTTMEAAYIYTAIFLLMIGLKLVSDMLRVEWPHSDYKGYFRLGIAAGTVLGAILLILLFGPQTFIGWPVAGRPVVAVIGILAAAAFVAALSFMLLTFGRRLNQLPSFNLLVLVGTLVLPMLSAFLIQGACAISPDSHFCIKNMDDVNWEQWRKQAEVLLIPGGLYVISIAIGLLWDWKRWLISAAVFYAIFIPLYTSFFTWGPGFVTGVIGGLGYWLAQQGVERGSQPWYYYLWLWPFYEFLVVIFGLIVGFIYVAAKRRGLALYEKVTLAPVLAIGITLGVSGPSALARPQYLMLLLAVLGFLAVPLAGAILPRLVVRRASAQESAAELELEDLPEPDDRAWLAEPGSITRHAIPAMFLTFMGLWMWASVIGYSMAGEKMPWLITHLTAPTVLFAGWVVGRLLTSLDWRDVWRRGGWAVFILGPVLLLAFYRMLEMAAFGQRPSLSTDNAALINTGTWVAALIVALGALAGLFVWAQRVETREVLRILGVLAFVLLAGLTARTAYRFAFITYDQAREFMVYAHGAPGTKEVMKQATEMSLRLNGDLSLKIAYDDDVAWPFTWYLRNFKNQAYYGASPSREQLDAPVVLVGDKNYSKVDPYMQQNYDGITYAFLWWPMQDYFYLTPERVSDAFTQDPQTGEFDLLHGLWDIWMYRDYTRYANAVARRTGQPAVDYSLAQWPVRHSMKMYVRRDVAAKLWDRGAAAVEVQPVLEDQCVETQQSLSAVLTIEGGLSFPRGIAVAPNGEIAVADAGNHRVAIFDAMGQTIRTIGTGQCRLREADSPGCTDPSGRGQFNDPWGVAYDAQGNLYVADTWNHRVQKFDTQGNFLVQWGKDGLSTSPPTAEDPEPKFWGPRAVAVGPDNRVYVVDTGNKRVQIFDTNGVYQGEFGTGGMTDGALDEPVGIAFGPDGLAYVADTWNLRVDVFDPQTSAFVRKWPVTAWYGQSTENKPYIAVDGKGRVYVTAPEQFRVMAYDSRGKAALCWGQQGADAASFGEPLGIATDKDGNVYVVDSTQSRVLKFAAP